MNLFNLPIVSKKIIVTRIICFFWIIAKIMSWKVWLANRFFPIVPPFNFLFFPAALHLILFIFSVAALFILLLFPSKRWLQKGIIFIEIFFCLLDQNRWQPWEYQYIFIILALVINYKNERNAVASIAFIFISVYIFSGLGKMNPVFSQNIRQEIIHAGIIHVNNLFQYNFLLFHCGYILGFIEILSGIGLLFHQTNKIAAAILIIMHISIAVLFGYINYDLIILPWNIAFAMILFIFFISNKPILIRVSALKQKWNFLFIIFFAAIPVLNFFGYWDFFLSGSLFSYKTPDMYIFIHKQGSGKVLSPFFEINKNKIPGSNAILINVRTWAFKEMQVPAYPELRVYKKIKLQLIQKYPDMVADYIVYKYSGGKKIRIELK